MEGISSPEGKMAEDKEIALEAIETAKNTGKIKKGINEATKALERGVAKLVVYAKDVQPAEIVLHLPVLSKEKGVPCIEVPSKEELGTAAGITVSTTAVVVIAEGDAKKLIEGLKGPEIKPAEKKEKPKEEAPKEEKKKEEVKEEKPKETPKEEPKKEEVKEEETKKEEKPKEEAPKEEKKEEKPKEVKEEKPKEEKAEEAKEE